MKSDTKKVLLTLLALLLVVGALYGIITATKVFVRIPPIVEEDFQPSDTDLSTDDEFGIVRRVTDPSTGAITGYEVRGVVLSTDPNENTIALNISGDTEEILTVSLGSDTDMLGFIDKRTESSVREGLLEKNTYTSDTAESVLAKVATNQTVLVFIPVWSETPDSSRCDDACMERIQELRTRGEVYIPLLEDVIQTSVIETDTVFTISIVEIEN